LAHHVASLRAAETPPAEFRRLIRRVSTLLLYEATRDLELQTSEVQTPLARMHGRVLRERIRLVPILRAGLGMVDAALDLLPEAEVWHLGLYRDEETARPVKYYEKVPPAEAVDVALVLDPMLATGGSATAALTTLREWGVSRVKLVAILGSAEGVRRVVEEFPEVDIFVGEIDPELNAMKFIVPGLGDAGDRMFGTQT
jgi:uracil phosphoribosyltransferase